MLAEVILKKYGAICSVASNGKEALEIIDDKNFDIVFADLHMPEVDGYMLANKIRERYLQVPLIALTANVMQNDIARIRASGFNDILLKPYKEAELLHMIARYAPVVIGADTLAEVKTDEAQQDTLYSMQEVTYFADNDADTVCAIIDSFVQSNKENVRKLAEAVHAQDIENIRNTAHKMLPAFNHFRVEEIVPVLRTLEVLQPPVNGVQIASIEKLQVTCAKLFDALEKEKEMLSAGWIK